ncbi:MAG: hypothetical protein ACLFRZ_11375 [Rhodosalinus sp.]
MRLVTLVIAAALTLGALAERAGAQGFQVRPLFVDGEVPPGSDVLIPIEITPTSQLEGRTIRIDVVQLAQSPQGAFRGVAFDPATVPERSAATWIEVPPEVTLEAREPSLVEVNLEVPFAARGSYAAGLLLSAPPPEGQEGLRLTLRVLVPIILGIEGRPARQDVRLADASLRYRMPEGPEDGAGDTLPLGTMVDTLIENNGGTFSSLRGDLWLDVKVEDDAWRQVRRVEIPQTRLLPETAITLPVELGRLLPTGDYRVRGELYVDGRRTAPLRREIAFEGHPEVQALATDIDLGVEPSVFEFAYQPGATRSGRVAVTNPAIDPVEVRIDVALPDSMAGRATATVRDTDLSAADWIEVQPDNFVLRPGQTRNLRLIARFPDAEAEQQNHYAALSLVADYLDGQRAGTAAGLVEVARQGGEDRRALAVEPVRLATTESAETYALSLRATNTGDVLLRPEVEVSVLDAAGAPVVTVDLSSDVQAPLMPLAARSFGGTLSAADLPEGDLVLLTLVRSDGAEVAELVQQISRDESGGLTLEAPR